MSANEQLKIFLTGTLEIKPKHTNLDHEYSYHAQEFILKRNHYVVDVYFVLIVNFLCGLEWNKGHGPLESNGGALQWEQFNIITGG